MTFEIEIDGRVVAVAIERTGNGRYRVAVPDGTRLVDAARVGEYGLSLLIDGASRSREVQIAPAVARGEFLVSLEGWTVPVTVNGRRTKRRGGDPTGADHGEQTIVAPMPTAMEARAPYMTRA